VTGDLRSILFHCKTGDHLVSREEAIFRDGDLVCPEHWTRDSRQKRLAADGGAGDD